MAMYASKTLAAAWGAAHVDDCLLEVGARGASLGTPANDETRKAILRRHWSMLQEATDFEDDMLRLVVLGAFDDHASVLYKGAVVSSPFPGADPDQYAEQARSIRETPAPDPAAPAHGVNNNKTDRGTGGTGHRAEPMASSAAGRAEGANEGIRVAQSNCEASVPQHLGVQCRCTGRARGVTGARWELWRGAQPRPGDRGLASARSSLGCNCSGLSLQCACPLTCRRDIWRLGGLGVHDPGACIGRVVSGALPHAGRWRGNRVVCQMVHLVRIFRAS